MLHVWLVEPCHQFLLIVDSGLEVVHLLHAVLRVARQLLGPVAHWIPRHNLVRQADGLLAEIVEEGTCLPHRVREVLEEDLLLAQAVRQWAFEGGMDVFLPHGF